MAVPSPKPDERAEPTPPSQDIPEVSGERSIGERPRRRIPSSVRRALWALAALAAYALLGYQLVPWLVRSQAIAYVREHYQRTLHIREVRFDPFALALEIDQLALPDADGKPVLRFDTLAVDFELWASGWRRAWVFHDITLDRARLRALIRPDGSLNLSDFQSHEPPGTEPSELPALAIDALTLNEGGVEFQDRSRAEPFSQNLSPVSFRLRNFRTTKEGGAFSFTARSDQGARFWWKGKFALAPVLSSEGKIAIGDVKIGEVADYLAATLPVELTRGRASVSLRYRATLDKAPRANVELTDVSLTELRLAARGHADDAVEIPRLQVHGVQLAWPERTVAVEAIQVTDLRTRLVLEPDGKLNLLRMAPASEGGPASGPAWKLKVDRFALVHASAALEDQSMALKLELASLDVVARAITLDPSLAIPFELAASFARDGSFTAVGAVTPGSTAADVKFALRDLRVGLAQPYVRRSAALTIEDGRLSIDGSLARVVEQAPRHELAAQLTLRDLRTRDELSNREFFSAQEVALHDVHYREQPDQLTIRKVALKHPYARVVLSSQQVLNVSEILKGGADQGGAETEPPPSEPGLPLAVQVDEVAIEAMRLSFADFFIKPNFALELHDVNGSMSGLSSDAKSRAKLGLRGTLGATAPVRITGQLQPFAYEANTDIALSWQNVPLPVFTPYSGRFAGYSIETGDLASWLTYKVRNGKLDAQHHIRIDQLEWGEATDAKESASVPVRLATALLRDRHGVINLDVPVKGNLHDPTFEVWPLVKQVLVNIAIKAVSAPFDFLGSLFAGAEKARFVDFAPGESKLEDADASELRALADALGERPALAVDVPLGVERSLDRRAIAERKFQRGLAQSIKQELWGNAKNSPYAALDPDDQSEVLEALYESLTGKKPKLGQLPEPSSALSFRERRKERQRIEAAELERMTRGVVRVDDGELEALGLARADAIERALIETGKVDSHRVLVSSVSQGQVRQEQGKVRFELNLK